ncbi:hypothetical protein Hanom_Chr12g01146091 [Helianthus anomalus]
MLQTFIKDITWRMDITWLQKSNIVNYIASGCKTKLRGNTWSATLKKESLNWVYYQVRSFLTSFFYCSMMSIIDIFDWNRIGFCKLLEP